MLKLMGDFLFLVGLCYPTARLQYIVNTICSTKKVSWSGFTKMIDHLTLFAKGNNNEYGRSRTLAYHTLQTA